MPVHARVIAGSATTSILTNQVLQQQLELQTVEKRMEDMKAALHLACGVLRQTNYMDNHVSSRGGCWCAKGQCVRKDSVCRLCCFAPLLCSASDSICRFGLGLTFNWTDQC